MCNMAVPKVKSTYSLDGETVRMLDGLARRWKVPKSEALRRAIRGAVASEPAGASTLAALEAAQRLMGLAARTAARWTRQVREERKASSRKREGSL
jgi:predicted transcriptional regulator